MMHKCNASQEGHLKENNYQVSFDLMSHDYLSNGNQSKTTFIRDKETKLSFSREALENPSKALSHGTSSTDFNESPEIMIQRVKSSMSLKNYFAYYFGDYDQFTKKVRNENNEGEKRLDVHGSQSSCFKLCKAKLKFYIQSDSRNSVLPKMYNQVNQVVRIENNDNKLMSSIFSSSNTINSVFNIDCANKFISNNLDNQIKKENDLIAFDCPFSYYNNNIYPTNIQIHSPEINEIELMKLNNNSTSQYRNISQSENNINNEVNGKNCNYFFANGFQKQNFLNMEGCNSEDYNSNRNNYSQIIFNSNQNSNTNFRSNINPFTQQNRLINNGFSINDFEKSIFHSSENINFETNNSRLVPCFSNKGRKICAAKDYSNKFDIN